MSFASRLWSALPLLAAVTLAPAGNAATACPDASKPWKSRLEASATNPAVARNPAIAMNNNDGCSLHCSGQEGAAATGSEREAHAPLPLTLVTRVEDVADWHAGIFEKLRGELVEEGATRYCRATPPVPPVRQL